MRPYTFENVKIHRKKRFVSKKFRTINLLKSPFLYSGTYMYSKLLTICGRVIRFTDIRNHNLILFLLK